MTFGRFGSLGSGFGRLGGGSGGSSIIPGTIVAGGGSYIWTGQDASLVIAETANLTADAGSYAWTGDTMSPLQDHFVTASGGSYAWTGQDATLTDSGAAGLGLQTSCTGFWELENTSWTDATGNGTTLTGTGSPTSVSGLVGNAASFDGSTQYLSAASNTSISADSGDFSCQAWVNLDVVKVSSLGIFSKGQGSGGDNEWGLGVGTTTSNVWRFACVNTGFTQFNAGAAASGDGLAATGAWYHLVGTFTASTGAMQLYVNGVANGTATLTGTLQDTSSTLNIGRLGSGAVLQDGLIDQCGFWKGRVLSAGDVTALYNGGAGLSWAAMA